ncbi:MAG: hypothetical protein AVDCRST_MAG85-3422 [uncultured Solirubrobacteraceae bacterium]|uniref:Uncharacterized protein n=1 Tax=uncultured Solirubrobacteraceae bacterium TaxID=1162706 RepID=A0A6J4TQP0_9ACTN|nr:MAG: hypothetical protein AVDCRST_MAG85-3422 [uncultured Solirubrobacteraceae bacterium]
MTDAKAVLTAPTVPVKTIAGSPAPSPVVNVRPAVPPSVSTPLPTPSVTLIGFSPESASSVVMALPLLLEKSRLVSSFTVCAPGTVFWGASFAAVSVTAIVSLSVVAAPPLLPWSSLATVIVSPPL